MAEIYRKSSIEKMSNPDQLDKTIKITSPLSWLVLIGIFLIIVATVLWAFFGKISEIKTVSGMVVSTENTGVIYADEVSTIKSISVDIGDSVKEGDTVFTLTTIDNKEKTITASANGTITEILTEPDSKVYAGTELARFTPESDEEQTVICYVSLDEARQLEKGMKVLVYPSSVDSQEYGHMEASISEIGEYPVSATSLGYIFGSDNLVADQFLSNGPVIGVTCEMKTDSSTESGFYWSSQNGADLSVPNITSVSAKILVSEEAPITKLLNSLKDKLEG